MRQDPSACQVSLTCLVRGEGRERRLSEGPLHWFEGADVLHFERGDDVRCLVNFGEAPVVVPGRVLLASDPAYNGELQADTACWYLPD